jgi:hypothetical protein
MEIATSDTSVKGKGRRRKGKWKSSCLISPILGEKDPEREKNIFCFNKQPSSKTGFFYIHFAGTT